jgi:transcriptional regulator with XRE-family HTH domain
MVMAKLGRFRSCTGADIAERCNVPPKVNQTISLARRLRELRESKQLTQAQLATALSSEGRVATPTVSSWESETNPKTPPEARIRAYARFFCTERSSAGQAQLIPEAQLTPDELDRRQELEFQLLGLFHAQDRQARRTFQFDVGPVIVICPDVPEDVRGPLADEKNSNFTKMQQYGDLDALIELYGHLRAENSNLGVSHRLASEAVSSDDLSSHVILLGGISCNKVTRRIQSVLGQVPIIQAAVDDLKDGDIFCVKTSDAVQSFYPEFGDLGDGKELLADVAYVARLRNPFKIDRTLTICNGIFSRGVLGAVRCLTDPGVREENEKYLADRFPDGEFAMLLRVQVVDNKTLAPDLQDPAARLYEWSPNQRGDQ